jgi:hypothetical protein
MIIFGLVALVLAGNATSGLIFGKMWLQNRVIARDSYPNFGWMIFMQIFITGVIVALFWTGMIKP